METPYRRTYFQSRRWASRAWGPQGVRTKRDTGRWAWGIQKVIFILFNTFPPISRLKLQFGKHTHPCSLIPILWSSNHPSPSFALDSHLKMEIVISIRMKHLWKNNERLGTSYMFKLLQSPEMFNKENHEQFYIHDNYY